MQIAILGLGKMGKNIAEKLMTDGHQVVVWNRSPQALDQLRIEHAEFIVRQQLVLMHSLEEVVNTTLKPRVVWSMVPAGDATEEIMKQLDTVVGSGDILIDGGNAHFKDTERRYAYFKAKEVRFLGIGVSGGIHGRENGFSMMVGGDQSAYEYITPLLDSLAKPSGIHTYFGSGGAGHFVKMVHNGIEYGMMQAIAEGFGVLEKSSYELDLSSVVTTYQEGSIISAFLLDMVSDALTKDPTLSHTEGLIGTNGEAKWTVEVGKEQNIPVDVIEKSLDFRNRSQYDKAIQETFVAKMVQAMRHEFGGHVVPKTEESKLQGQ